MSVGVVRVLTTMRIETPLGTMEAAATDLGICLLGWPDGRHHALELKQLAAALGSEPVEGDSEHFEALRRQLNEYFRGGRREFDVPLELVGTEFQRQVWEGLLQIPYGQTASYGRQAAAIGRPSAVRAVANANGKNKISIIVPCHRVIGSDGTLTGYGGGMWRKERLLALERASDFRRASDFQQANLVEEQQRDHHRTEVFYHESQRRKEPTGKRAVARELAP